MLTRITEAGLIGLLVFAPLPFGSNVYWADFVLSIGSYALLVLWLFAIRRASPAPVYRERRGGYAGFPAWPLIPFAILLLVPILQLIPVPIGFAELLSPDRAALADAATPGIPWTTISVYPHATARALVRLAGWAAVFLVAFGCTNTRGAARRIAWALVLSGTWQALYGGVEYLSGRQRIFGFEKAHYLDRATGTFINHNHYAAYLALTLGVAVGLLLFYLGRDGRGAQKVGTKSERAGLVFFFVVVIAVGILMSGSRGGLVAASVAVFAFGIAVPLARKRWQRPVVVIAAVACVIGATAWIGRAPLSERLEETVRDLPTANQRTYAWGGSLRMIGAAPLVGGGAGTFEWRFPAYRGTVEGGHFRHAHSDYLEWTADLGAVGALALVAAIGLVLFVSARQRAQRHSRLSRALSLGGVVALTAVLIHATYDFPFQVPGIATTFFAVLGWTAAAATRRLE